MIFVYEIRNAAKLAPLLCVNEVIVDARRHNVFIKLELGELYFRLVDIGVYGLGVITRDCREKQGESVGILKSFCLGRPDRVVLADKNNRLLGAVIVAPNATSIAAELSTPLRYDIPLKEIANNPHYLINDYDYLIKLAAQRLINKK